MAVSLGILRLDVWEGVWGELRQLYWWRPGYVVQSGDGIRASTHRRRQGRQAHVRGYRAQERDSLLQVAVAGRRGIGVGHDQDPAGGL